MITPEYLLTMAQYNKWQNSKLYAAADKLSDAERRQDRGAFFSSIYGTLNHLIWGDVIWMSRFDGWEPPDCGIPESPNWVDDWQELSVQRPEVDLRIVDWATRMQGADLSGDFTWFSAAAQRDVTRPFAICLTHFFNHQTHHRGQVHAMLTAAGQQTGDTDLVFMTQ